MPRSAKRTITIPHPVREALLDQYEEGILDYRSENGAWIGLARYQLIVGKPHPITAAIDRMRQSDQDTIDDFLHEVSRRRLNLKGQFLEKLVALGVARCQNPTEQEVTELLPDELLRLAKAWRKAPEKVIGSLHATSPSI